VIEPDPGSCSGLRVALSRNGPVTERVFCYEECLERVARHEGKCEVLGSQGRDHADYSCWTVTPCSDKDVSDEPKNVAGDWGPEIQRAKRQTSYAAAVHTHTELRGKISNPLLVLYSYISTPDSHFYPRRWKQLVQHLPGYTVLHDKKTVISILNR
jgi:hypothetical protein